MPDAEYSVAMPESAFPGLFVLGLFLWSLELEEPMHQSSWALEMWLCCSSQLREHSGAQKQNLRSVSPASPMTKLTASWPRNHL